MPDLLEMPKPELLIVPLPELAIITQPQLKFSFPIWITAYNREVPVNEMSTKHINNCINCWNGVGNMIIPDDYLGGKEKWITIFQNELIRRN